MGTRGKADVEIAGRFIRGLVWDERTGFGPAKRVHLCTYCCPNVVVPGIASTYFDLRRAATPFGLRFT